MAKGLLVNVLRDAAGGDCTNGGVTSRFTRFVLTGDVVDAPFEASEDVPQLQLVRRSLMGGYYIHAEPVKERPEGMVGQTFGGNFIYSSDSRFPNQYPIPVHDRWETKEQYDLLSQ